MKKLIAKKIAKAFKPKKKLPSYKKKIPTSEKELIAAIAVTAPPLIAGLGMSSKAINDEKVRQRDAYRAKQEREKEAEKKKKENKNNKPKKMKTGGIAIKGFGKAFLKGKN